MRRAASTALGLLTLGMLSPLLVGTARAQMNATSDFFPPYGNGNETESGLEPVALAPRVDINASDAMEHVIELDENNFDSSLASHDRMMVFFYSPNCEHSQLLAPNWASLAGRLKSVPTVLPATVALAKLNVQTYHPETPLGGQVAELYHVGNTPAVRWIVNGNASTFDAGNTADEMLTFLRGHFNLPPLSAEDTATDSTDGGSIAADDAVVSEQRALFDEMDSDGSGDVSRSELFTLSERLRENALHGAVDMSGQALPVPDISVEQQTDELLDKLDANRDGKIDLPEFMDQFG